MLDTSFTARSLQDGKEYEFRVAASNKAGIGKWTETEQAIEARAADCKFLAKRIDFKIFSHL